MTRAERALPRPHRVSRQLSPLRAIARQATSGPPTAPHQAAAGDSERAEREGHEELPGRQMATALRTHAPTYW
jgi:hypothetical protein